MTLNPTAGSVSLHVHPPVFGERNSVRISTIRSRERSGEYIQPPGSIHAIVLAKLKFAVPEGRDPLLSWVHGPISSIGSLGVLYFPSSLLARARNQPKSFQPTY